MRYAEIPCIVTVHSVSGNTLCDAQIWGILPHIALAASGFSCFQHENASWYSNRAYPPGILQFLMCFVILARVFLGM